MAPFVPAANVAQVNLNMLWRQVPVMQTLYLRNVNGDIMTTSRLLAAATVVRNWWTGVLRVYICNELSLISVKATDLTSQVGPTYTLTTNLPLAGAASEESVQNTIAFCVKFLTEGRGPGARGRNYIAGTQSTVVVDNFYTALAATAYVDCYEALPGLVTDQEFEHVVISRELNKEPRVTALVRPVTAYGFTTRLISTQRERRSA